MTLQGLGYLGSIAGSWAMPLRGPRCCPSGVEPVPVSSKASITIARRTLMARPRRSAWAMGKRFRGWIARAQGGLCAGCAQPLNLAKKTKPSHADAPTIDHVAAKSGGGSPHLGNVIVMHRKCNNRKADRAPTGCERLWLETVNAKLSDEFEWCRSRTAPIAGE